MKTDWETEWRKLISDPSTRHYFDDNLQEFVAKHYFKIGWEKRYETLTTEDL